MRVQAAIVAAAVILAGAVGAPAFGQSPASLAGLDSVFTASIPDTTAGYSGQMSFSDHTQVLAVEGGVLTLKHDVTMAHANGKVSNHVASAVTIPLSQVTLDRVGAATRFTCADKSQCMNWVHTDYYAEDGSTFGDAGTAAEYRLNLDDAANARLFAVLCRSVRCS